MTEKTQDQQQQSVFQINKIYIKDATFETKGGSEIFMQEWKPELNIQLDLKINQLDDDKVNEVVLTVKCAVKSGDKEAFATEVEQAGIFTIDNMNAEQKEQTLKSFCPNILYPYAREAISDMVMRGGFPQLCLAPVNFDASTAANAESVEAVEN